MKAVDEYILRQTEPKPSRPEAIGKLVDLGLEATTAAAAFQAASKAPPAAMTEETRTPLAGKKASASKVCPECGHRFQGSGWDGIDAHWKSKHEHLIPYAEAWPQLQAGTYSAQSKATAAAARAKELAIGAVKEHLAKVDAPHDEKIARARKLIAPSKAARPR